MCISKRRFRSMRYFMLWIVVLTVFYIALIISQFSQDDGSSASSRRRSKSHIHQVDDDQDPELLRRIRIQKLRSKFFYKMHAAKQHKGNRSIYELDERELESLNVDYVRAMGRLQRIVHLDLKGAPPKLAYLKELIPYLKKVGATGILLEYEDHFPYYGELSSIRNQHHYTQHELQQIVKLIQENELTMIPYIQTYGRMEFILKLKEFAHLRENRKHFQVITPCLNETYDKVIFRMIDQMLEMHGDNFEYIHIGCDEVNFFNEHEACNANLNGTSAPSLAHLNTIQDFFIYHVTRILDYVHKKRPGLKVMIWEDMFRHHLLTNVTRDLMMFAKRLVPMVWDHKRDVEIEEDTWKSYDQLFGEIWMASAFKGATSNLEIVPNSVVNYNNHLYLIDLIRRVFVTYPAKVRGIAFTGVSRYDHMQAVCEIMPASVPSLVLCLQRITQFDQNDTNVFTATKNLTHCNYAHSVTGFITSFQTEIKSLSSDVDALQSLYECSFPGSQLYKWLLSLKIVIANFEHLHQKYSRVLNKFNMEYKYINTIIYERACKFYPYMRKQFLKLKARGEREFDKYFYADLFEEISNVYIMRYVATIDTKMRELNSTKLPEFAPVRPFNQIQQTLI